MSAAFFDSSALVKRYRAEAGTDRVSRVLVECDRLVISRLAELEVSAALVRRATASSLPDDELDQILTQLDRDILESFDVVELNSDIVASAKSLTRSYRLRAADAIQLACAMVAAADVPSESWVFVGSDRELNDAVANCGMDVIDPTAP